MLKSPFKIAVVMAAVFIIVWSAVWTTAINNSPPPPAEVFTVLYDWIPDEPIPDDAQCEYSETGPDIICSAPDGETDVTATADIFSRKIKTVDYVFRLGAAMPIGDFMLRWGNPSYLASDKSVCWVKSLRICAVTEWEIGIGDFSPNTRVISLSVDDDKTPHGEWRGFQDL